MMSTEKKSKCPMHTNQASSSVNNWWPNKLNLKPLGTGIGPESNSTSYSDDFLTLDLDSVKADINAIMVTSQDWWPADYGHYGPFFVRMTWHSAGTYRIFDGRGGGGRGNQRFAPLNSWPDNANLDKARRLLWPVKQKYGKKLSWGDLMIFAGNCALESMGFKTFGFAGGRADIWEPEEDVYWGSETAWLKANRGGLGDGLDKPLGAVQMGLIYVNPEGPGGNPDILAAAQDIRTTFGRMAMNDEETVALIAGGHTFGKAHGAANPEKHVGPEPEGATIKEQGFGWNNTYGSGKGGDAISSGLEGAWTNQPTKWDNGYFENLFGYEWEMTKSPGGATQWIPVGGEAVVVPDAYDDKKKHSPIMFTTDLALKFDPIYGPISKRFYENPEEFADAFAKAWYKLTHRDMGPYTRCLGKLVPEVQIWQDPVPEHTGPLISAADIAELKASLLKVATVDQLIQTAWASASTFRGTDYRGGSNGSRVRLEPQLNWAANDPIQLNSVLSAVEGVQTAFNSKGGANVSIADLIVLGGCAALEFACGNVVEVPFVPGRTDATMEQTDVPSFDVLEPFYDGFRNYYESCGFYEGLTKEALLVDKARMLMLSKAEMTALVGGMRVLGGNSGGSMEGVFTATPGKLSNDFFVNLLDMSTEWKAAGDAFVGVDRSTGETKWTASSVDLVFGSNSELRAIAEYYACDDSKDAFVFDFVAAWVKVMNLGFA